MKFVLSGTLTAARTWRLHFPHALMTTLTQTILSRAPALASTEPYLRFLCRKPSRYYIPWSALLTRLRYQPFLRARMLGTFDDDGAALPWVHFRLSFCVRMCVADWTAKCGVLAGVCRCHYTVVHCARISDMGAGSFLVAKWLVLVGKW